MAINKKILKNTFNQVGNLAFYDGWHPEYIYFNTLLKAGEYFTTGTGPRQYNPELAEPIAQQAITDAQIKANYNGLSQEDSIAHFSERFTDIITFLKQAYDYELRTETAYFTNKYNQLINTFSEEERKNIPQIQECIDMIKNGKDGVDFNYTKFTTLINILMQGYNNSKTIIKYESTRLQELDKAIKSLLHSKASQLSGQATAEQWKNAQKKIEKHYNKFKRNMTISYIDRGSMTTKKNGKYIIRGAYRFAKFQRASQVADRKLARWAESLLQQLVNNKAVITKLATAILKQYPLNGDFTHLTEEVRGIIIQGVIEYGRQNLSKVLNSRFDVKDLEAFADKIIESNVFDTVQTFKVNGLPQTFGQTIKEAKLLKDVKKIADIHKNGEKLYSLVHDFLKNESQLYAAGEESYLIQAMQYNKKITGKTAYDEATNLIALVEQLKAIRDKIEQDKEKTLKNNEEYQKEYEVKSKYSESATIEVRIQDGKVLANIDSVNAMIVEEGIFKKSSSKDLTSLINTLMAQTSSRLRQDITESLTKAHNDQIFGSSLTEEQLLNEVAGELRQVSIRINGPTLSELVEAWLASIRIGKNGAVYHTGQQNNKNDNVIIEIGNAKLGRKISNMQLKKAGTAAQQAVNDLLEKINQAKLDLQLKIAEKGQQVLATSIKNYDSKQGPTTSERYLTAAKFSYDNIDQLAQEYEEINTAWKAVQNAGEELERYLKDKKMPEKTAQEHVNTILRDMSNSFQISTTVKAYNTYNSEIGFVGGSLGTNLEVQLDNLTSIFQSAGLGGMIEEDMNWLRSAIINCSPKTVVGEKNKGLIENYLAAAAAFALFDEGGQENMIISDTYKSFFEGANNGSSIQILHLYRVNSTYVPGSQVLLRTINTLETEVIPQINNIPQVMNRGAGIMIINNANPSAIPNRPISQAPKNKQPWTTVGKQAEDNIQLKILFLAGLMDIVNKINSELNGIEMIT